MVGDDIQKFKDFLEDFVLDDLPSKPTGFLRRHPLPVLTLDEIEGECISIALNTLKKCNCPSVLSFALARCTANKYLEGNRSADQTAGKDITVKVLEPIIKESLKEVCTDWKNNLPKLNYERPPVVSEYAIQNKRRKMEDRHNVLFNLNILNNAFDISTVQLYGIYDGHGGVETASYVSKQLHLKLTNHASFPSDVPLALKSVLKELDESFCEKAEPMRIKCGCTALVVVIYEKILHLAWIGDSQACVIKNGVALELMDPHKPEREDERKRITDAGGQVFHFGVWRVNGNLAVSRAIGDYELKPFVCADADITSLALDGEEDYVCLACDGFWDVFNAHDLPRLMHEHVSAGGKLEEVAEFLCRKASEAGSDDNITVVVVFLRDEKDINFKCQEKSKEKVRNSVQENDEEMVESNIVNTSSSPQSPNDDEKRDKSKSCDSLDDKFAVLTGSKMRPCEKEKAPHPLLLNYVRNLTDKLSTWSTNEAKELF